MRSFAKWPVVVLLAAFGGTLLPVSAGALPTKTEFNYQGQLKQNGAPVSDTCDFEFRLFDVDEIGTPIAPVSNATLVDVANGLFSTPVDFGGAVFDGNPRWLEVTVRCPAGVGGFVPLAPRELILPTPYSLQTRGLFVDHDDAVGIGTTTPSSRVHIEDARNMPIDLDLLSDAAFKISNGAEQALIIDSNQIETIGGRLYLNTREKTGIDNDVVMAMGEGRVGIGELNPLYKLEVVSDGNRTIYGNNTSTDTGSRAGVFGTSAGETGRGVYGEAIAPAGANFGVRGESYSSSGRGVMGYGVSPSGVNYGIYGKTQSAEGYAGYFEGGRNYFEGDVGIGTDQPAATLHIVHDQTSAPFGGILVENVNPPEGPSAVYLDLKNNDPTINDTYRLQHVGNVPGREGNFEIWDRGAGAARLAITSAGNVGIGTATPDRKLSIIDTQNGTLSYALKIANVSAQESTATGALFQVDSGGDRGKGAIAYRKTGTWNRGEFHFLQNSNADSEIVSMDDSVMKITNAGDVGIGIDPARAPDARLEVADDGLQALTYPLKISNHGTGVGTAAGMLFHAGWDTESTGKGAIVYERRQTHARGALHFLQNSDPDLSVKPSLADAVMTIANDGYVGIGTTSPSTPLHVVNEPTHECFVQNIPVPAIVGGTAIYGVSREPSAVGVSMSCVHDEAGVWGDSERGYGVKGTSDVGDGILGYASGYGAAILGVQLGPGSAGKFYGKVRIYGELSVDGDTYITGSLTKGGGSFKIDHPLDPANKYLSHSFVESPDMMNVYNGNVTTDGRGYATITMPDYFEVLNRDFRYQLTVIDAHDTDEFVQTKIVQEVRDRRFKIKTSTPNVKVSWQVTGIRHDAWAQANRIPVNEDKPEAERGKYQHPELYGKPQTMSVHFARHGVNELYDSTELDGGTER